MGSGDNFKTNISKRLHIGNVKEAYQSTNKVNYSQQMLKHNDQCTSLDYMEETISYLPRKGWYEIDSANVFNLLSAANKRRKTRRAHLSCLNHCQKAASFLPLSQLVHYL
jgi:hypothetical protein